MDELTQFLRTLFHSTFPGFFLEIRPIPYPTPQFFDDIETCAKAIKPRSKNIHFGVGLRVDKKGDEAHTRLLPALFIDIDVIKDHASQWEEVDQKIEHFDRPPSIIVNSGRGYHLYWLLDEYLEITSENRNLIRGILAGLAEKLGGDPSCHDLSRLMRLPGTYNCKDANGKAVTFAQCPQPIPVRLEKCDTKIRYSVEDFRAFFIDKKPKVKQIATKNEGAILEGSRNQSLTSLAGSMRQAGLSHELLLGALEGINARICSPPLPPDEVDRVCKSVMRYPIGSSDTPKYMDSSEVTIPTVSIQELLTKTPDVSYLIEEIAPRGGVILLVADAGVGKTWICIHASLALATGQPFFGHFKVPNLGKTLILDEENTPPLQKKRVSKLIKGQELSVNLSELPIRYSLGAGINLTDPRWVASLETILQDFQPDLVILDSLVRFHQGDENSSRDMALLFSQIKQLITAYGTTFLICHHKRKPGVTGNNGSTAFRGSTEIRAFMDAQFDIAPSKIPGRLVVTNTKSRFREPIDPFEFEINDVGDGTRIDFYSFTHPSAKLESTQQFLKELVDDEQWHGRQEILRKGKKKGFTRDALDQARQVLAEQKGYKEIRKRNAVGIQKVSDESTFLGGSDVETDTL